jgi:peroxiredoxin
MTVNIGDKLNEATLVKLDGDEMKPVNLRSLIAGQRVVLFGLPGAFTGTCSTAHLPSFMRNKEAFAAKGIDTIICFSVNDPWVMNAWAETTGAKAAGIEMLADANGEFTKSLGLEMSAPAVGFFDRCKRCAMIVDDGVVTVLQLEQERGVCELTAGETLLDLA